MTTLGGGSVAAYGLKYQYLATLEHFLRYLREHPELIARTTLVVEPVLEDSDGVDDDIVDFGIEVDDVAVHQFQVKATTKPDRYRLQPSDARVALDRLLRYAVDNSVLLTNKPLSSDLASECAIADADGLVTTYTWAEGPQPGPDAGPRQAQRSFDYPLLSYADGVVSELFGVRRGRLAKLRRSVVAREAARPGRHTRRRGLLARLLPVRRTTFVIDIDRTILKVVSSEVRASVHADETLWFLENHTMSHSSPHARQKDTDAHRQSERNSEPIGDWFTEPETADEPSLVRPYTLTGGRADSGVDLALEAPVEALETTANPPRWRRNDVRGQILTWCADSPSVAEIAARVSLPVGATRFLVEDLVAQGYVRVHAPLGDSMTIDERRELIRRTLSGLRAL